MMCCCRPCRNEAAQSEAEKPESTSKVCLLCRLQLLLNTSMLNNNTIFQLFEFIIRLRGCTVCCYYSNENTLEGAF